MTNEEYRNYVSNQYKSNFDYYINNQYGSIRRGSGFLSQENYYEILHQRKKPPHKNVRNSTNDYYYFGDKK